jgi:hypothetical protein
MPIAVEPTGHHDCPAFVDYADGHGEFKILREPYYPKSPRGRAVRDRRGDRISMGHAAHALGITVVQLCGIEQSGAFTLSEADWQTLERVVEQLEGDL